jgi:flagellar hook-associated protein 2
VSSLSTVDGLVSGLSTSSVISQLMQVEAQPQTNLKNQVTKQNTVISAYQSVNSKFTALQTAAQAFTSTGLAPVNATWQSVKATSSSTAITATATAGAPTGTTTFSVTSLAKAQVSTAELPPGSPISDTDGLTFTVGTGDNETTSFIPVSTDDSAEDVAKRINAAKIGVTASVVTTDDGSVLQFTSAKTGVSNGFSVTGLLMGTPTAVTAASDAKVTVGTIGSGGYTVSSASNTFSNVIPGVTFTATAEATNASVTVNNDPEAIADKMQALVDAANATMSQIGTQTAYNATTKTGGALSGNFEMRQLKSTMLSSVSSGLAGYGSYKQVGLQLDSNGVMKFDRSAFLSAYSSDPAKVEEMVTTGLAKSFDDIAEKATDSTTGTLTTAIQSGNNQIRDLKNRISDWDVRLASRQTALQRQFSNLEVALGKMKNQSSWLAGQISSLSSNSS